jgi:penicillin-binding protein 1A
MLRWTLRVFTLLFFLLTLCAAGLFVVFYQMVSKEAETRIQRGIIDSIIFSESPVYYDDEKSVIGVFFEKTHRKYIHYKDIPQVFVKSIVAAEDRTFYDHPGFDIKAIVRASIANMKAGRIAQGGSTITQQTAKNIFKREKRSYLAKMKELIQALLLEKEYSKEEILEMYVNQFFVTGFGRGLRIAAKYFFDKNAEDLDLVESAFIAGSVKSPNRYNPFIKRAEGERKEALRLAKARKDYVLGNMLAMNFIAEEEYKEAMRREVPFKEGRVTYRLNVILDYIRDQLDSEYFKAILQEQGVDNIATSGIKIYTSMNKEIQEGALKSIRKHLPLLDVKLSGYGGDLLLEKYKELAGDPLKRQETDDIPFLARISEIKNDKDNPRIVVSWEDGRGIIDYEGLQPMGEAWLKGKTGVWAEFGKRHIPEFLNHFNMGNLVPVQFTGNVGSDGQMRLLLSKIPALEGGIVVLKEGMIKAMVGGFFDRFFNRAVDAKRQLGSIFKPIVYAAALELKWNTLDPLINMKDIFPFEITFYVPRPDHEPEADKVSMVWAGAKSENLATVWLLYHLTDHLNASEFRQVVDLLGLGRRGDETYEVYASRIRDKYGVMVDDEALKEAAFEESKKEIESDLIFSEQEDALVNLQRLHHKVDPVELAFAAAEGVDEAQILRLSFQKLQALNSSMKERLQGAREMLGHHGDNQMANQQKSVAEELSNFYLMTGGLSAPVVVYTESRRPPYVSRLRALVSEWGIDRIRRLTAEEVWIDALMPSKSIDLLQSHANSVYEQLRRHRKYDEEVLFRLSDFKRLVNLLYVVRLAERMGVSTKLDPVLSFPLGANSISITEAALAYHAIMSGKVYQVQSKKALAMVPVITKIEDRQGNVIWEYKHQSEKILSDRVCGMTSDILRMVMLRGTGRSAKDAIQMRMQIEGQELNIPIPTFGKTGTANRFTNSSFVGFIPGPNESSGQMEIEHGYVIASYVGYDDNRPMKGRQIVIYGSSGALPLWVDTGNAIANSQAYRKNLQVADFAFDLQSIPSYAYAALQPVSVSPVTGLPFPHKEQESSGAYPRVLADVESDGVSLTLKRVFEPMRGGRDDILEKSNR